MISEKHKKYAVFTLDMEAFSDTGCVKASNQEVDDELLDGMDEYLKLLDDHDIKSTIFAISQTAIMGRERLKKHLANGHRLALHGYEHTPPTEQDDTEFTEKLIQTKKILEKTFDTDIIGYRAPFFGLDDERFRLIRNLGFKYDSSRVETASQFHKYGAPDIRNFRKVADNVYADNGFYEFGICCSQFFGAKFPISGGGYLRMGDWPFMKTMIKKHINKNDYYVFYLHPFELSKHKIPKLKNLNLGEKMYLSFGFATFKNKIRKIINMLRKADFEFVTFEQLSDIFDKEQRTINNEQNS